MSSKGEEMLALVQAGLRTKYSVGDTAFLLSNKWLFRLKRAARNHAEFGIPIDNNHLLKDGHVKEHMIIPQDMIIVPEPVWKELVAVYGGGPELPVPCLENSKKEVVPVPIPTRYAISYGTSEEPLVVYMEALRPVGELKKVAVGKFGLKSGSVTRLRSFQGTVLNDADRLEDVCSLYGQKLVLERQNASGVWSDDSAGVTERLVGFVNPQFTNMCYVNATVQCLMNVNGVVEFAEGCHSDQPIIRAFHDCVNKYWKTSVRTMNLTDFRSLVGKYNKDFSTNMQCDAHEFLATLVGYLVKETNTQQNLKAEYCSGDGTNDQEICRQFWRETTRVSDSQLLPVLHGVLGNRVECCTCNNVSSHFNTFLSLLVNVPTRIQITFIKYNMEEKVQLIHTFVGYVEREEIERAFWNSMKVDERPTVVFGFYLNDGISLLGESVPNGITDFFAFEVPDDSKRYVIVLPTVSERTVQSYPFLCELSGTENNEICQAIEARLGIEKPLHQELLKSPLLPHEKYPYLYKSTLPISLASEQTPTQLQDRQSESVMDTNGCTIEQGLKNFLEPDQVSFECPNCGKTSGVSRTGIWMTPQVLIIHLNRFNSDSKRESSIKIEDTLNMSEFVQLQGQNLQYHLAGFLIHRGTLRFGHYTACVRHRDTRKWLYCNDAQVREITEKELTDHKADAYVIFYERE